MSDTVQLAWTADEDAPSGLRLAQPGDRPTIAVEAATWQAIIEARAALAALEAPLIAQAQAAEQAWLESRPRSQLFSPAMHEKLLASVYANVTRQAQVLRRIHDARSAPVVGQTIAVRLPKR
ncbi:MAG TPA: hypothetical protein PKC83_10965 [Gemmatimonadaceae bacterium]|nr:hypothetical protein [Gemmatimonadaceae bacterium]